MRLADVTFEDMLRLMDMLDAAILRILIATVVVAVVGFVLICAIEFISLAWEERKWEKNWKMKS